MTLRANRFWGGVKIPFLPATRLETTIQATVNYVDPGPDALRMPKIYWRTDVTGKNLITPGVEFDLVIPVESSYLEFFVEYTTDNKTEYNTIHYTGGVNVSITSYDHNYVLPTLGVRTYTFQVKRAQPLPYLYPIFNTSNSAVWPANTNYKVHEARFQFQNGLLRKPMMVKILDTNANALAQGLSQSALEAKSDWADNVTAGWPAYTGTANVLGPLSDLGGPANMTALGMVGGATVALPIVDNDTFIVQAGMESFRIQRLYLASTVANALAAAKAINPNVTTLSDSLVLDITDAGKPGPALIGNDSRVVPQTRLDIPLYP